MKILKISLIISFLLFQLFILFRIGQLYQGQKLLAGYVKENQEHVLENNNNINVIDSNSAINHEAIVRILRNLALIKI